ncbi:MAG: PadR family transcriptional regulator [Peptococcaceae bacterium]|jgi:DNA-binding PadR family transcriptional regulator|nr:PadR family transcriptional regulator [Peptococcaceae bacterium]
MDKLILGLLMLKRFTAYEIRSYIQRYFKEMCSDSMGSIQAALKKLLSAQLVTFSENVEKGVNKKRYSITAQGRKEFLEWLSVPADMTASKNMEIGKLLFMGLLPEEKRLPLIDEIISSLDAILSGLQGLLDSVNAQLSMDKEATIEDWENDPEYLAGILDATQTRDAQESANGIGAYEMYALYYGIDSLRFNLDWFRKLRGKIESGEQWLYSE